MAENVAPNAGGVGPDGVPLDAVERLVGEVRSREPGLTTKQVSHRVNALAGEPVSFKRVLKVMRRLRKIEGEPSALGEENVGLVLNAVDTPVATKNVLGDAAPRQAQQRKAAIPLDLAVDADEEASDPDFAPDPENEEDGDEDDDYDEEDLDEDEALALGKSVEEAAAPEASPQEEATVLAGGPPRTEREAKFAQQARDIASAAESLATAAAEEDEVALQESAASGAPVTLASRSVCFPDEHHARLKAYHLLAQKHIPALLVSKPPQAQAAKEDDAAPARVVTDPALLLESVNEAMAEPLGSARSTGSTSSTTLRRRRKAPKVGMHDTVRCPVCTLL